MRKFRALQESVDICLRMLNVAMYYGGADEIDYWTKRTHGYQKLAQQKGIELRPIMEIDEE